MQQAQLWIGSYLEQQGQSIHLFPSHLSHPSTVHWPRTDYTQLSFMAFSHSCVYVANRILDFKHGQGSAISVYRRDAGGLTWLQDVYAGGSGTVYLKLSPCGQFLLAAHYLGHSVTCFALEATGCIRESVCQLDFAGSSINKQRQLGSHPHSIEFDLSGDYLFVPDLGADKIRVLQWQSHSGQLLPRAEWDVSTLPGSGPRHICFHPSGHLAFVSHELSNQVSVYRYCAGQLRLVDYYALATELTCSESSSAATLKVHPSGKFLYVSFRGKNEILLFSIHESTGRLELQQRINCGGQTPISFAIDDTGTQLAAANLDSNNISSFVIDEMSGGLSFNQSQPCPSPIFIAFA